MKQTYVNVAATPPLRTCSQANMLWAPAFHPFLADEFLPGIDLGSFIV